MNFEIQKIGLKRGSGVPGNEGLLSTLFLSFALLFLSPTHARTHADTQSVAIVLWQQGAWQP